MDFSYLISLAEKTFESCNKSEYRMCAIIYRKSQIFAISNSEERNFKKLYYKTFHAPSIHAEISACIKVYNSYIRIHHRPLKADMFIMRNNSLGLGKSSKPCKDCIDYLQNKFPLVQLKKISYFQNGTIITEKFKELENEHVSRGFLHYKGINRK